MHADLNYCKNCGAKLVKETDEDAPKSMLDHVLTSLCVIALFGLGILVGLVAVLLSKGVDEKGVILLAFFYLVALSGIFYKLLSQASKLIDANLKERRVEISEFVQPARELKQATTAQLEEFREPAVASVTENTTRIFDKIPLKEN